MKKIISLLAVLCLCTTVSDARAVKGDGKIVLQDRHVASFNTVAAGSMFCLFLRQGPQQPIKIETDGNLQELVYAEVSDGYLSLSISGEIKHISKLNVYITVPQLNQLILNGVAKAYFQTPFETKGRMLVELSGASVVNDLRMTADELEAKLSGSSQMDVATTSKKTSLELSGSSRLVIKGGSETMRVGVTGVSHLTIDFKASKNADIYLDGAGRATGTLTTDRLRAETSGAALLNLGGKWNKQRLSASGSSFINTEEAQCQESEVEASGASVIALSKTTIKKISTSGASRIRTQGAQQVHTNEVVNMQELVEAIVEQNMELHEGLADLEEQSMELHEGLAGFEEQALEDGHQVKATAAQDLEKVGDDFAKLAKKLGEKNQNATFKINGKVYLVKDVKISTLKNKDGSISLFINGEEVHKFK